MKYTRADISENIGCSMIIDEKFKTGTLTIRFITDLDGSTAAANSLGVSVLSSSNKKYRSIAALNEKLSMLYGASISSFARKRGDVQILAVAASWLDSRYAIDGEDIDSEMLAIVRDCIFAPNAENGEFDSEAFAITKKDLIDRIDAELNNKRGYAISRASEVAFEGEPAQFSCYGTKESAEAVTSAQAYTAYRKLIENAHVEICYISPRENPGLVKMFRECFGTTERRSVKFRSISPVKNDVRRVSDTYDVQQCKMVLTFKSDSEDMYAMKMLSTIYGETPVSKLFMNVREKLSLCYYCACRTVGSKGAIMVDSGVERKNLGRAEEEILHQLDEIRQGNVSDEEMQSALLSIENALTQVGDTPSSYSGWFFERFCDGDIVTPQEQLERYRLVSKERLIEAARSLKLDSIYFMLDKEDKND